MKLREIWSQAYVKSVSVLSFQSAATAGELEKDRDGNIVKNPIYYHNGHLFKLIRTCGLPRLK